MPRLPGESRPQSRSRGPFPKRSSSVQRRRRKRKPGPPPLPPGSSEHSATIAELAPQGFTAPQIAGRLGVTPARVRLLAKRDRVELPGAGGRCCRVAVPLPTAVLPTLDAIATGADVPRAEIIRRLVVAAMDAGGKPAVRLLGKGAQPKRRYRARSAQQSAVHARQEPAQAHMDMPRPGWLADAVAAGLHPLRAVRLQLGLRLADVEALAGVAQNRVGEIERGTRPFTARMQARLAAALVVEPWWLNPGHARSGASRSVEGA